jgi:hypothetical protein
MRTPCVAFVVLWVGLYSTGVCAQSVNNVKLLTSSGEVQGTVHCDTGGPATRAVVYLAGESFLARPNAEGAFTLRYVPAGTYDLVIEVARQEVDRTSITVTERTLTSLPARTVSCPQELSFCGDGVVNTAAGEECDTSGESASCNINCTLVRCGDGIVNVTAGEQCEVNLPCPSGFACSNCHCVAGP